MSLSKRCQYCGCVVELGASVCGHPLCQKAYQHYQEKQKARKQSRKWREAVFHYRNVLHRIEQTLWYRDVDRMAQPLDYERV